MIITIQQPEHVPWLGFFNKMALVDEFIYLDNVQFKKRYFENRNKIRVGYIPGWDWITVPVITKSRCTQKINEVEIDYSDTWNKNYLNKLKHVYAKAQFFKEIFPGIEGIIGRDFLRLSELNIALIEFVRCYLNIKTKVSLASQICYGRGSDLILDMCVNCQADTYLSGPDGRNYLKLNTFKEKGVQVEFHDYIHPAYEQLHAPFMSHMSTLDLLFTYGKDSISILKK